MTSMRMSAGAGAALVALWFVLAAAFGLFGCATAPQHPKAGEAAPAAAPVVAASPATPRSIALNLHACLRSRTAFAPHLALACECVERAEAECQRHGLDRWCAWNGWDDADRDSWTVGACLRRRTP